MIKCLFLLLSWSALAAPVGIQERWSAVSDPLIMGNTFEIRLFALPFNGEVQHKRKFWSGDYWALNKGNINLRWNAPKEFQSVPSPTKAQVLRMTQSELARLSATEKYDIWQGRYDYPLKNEVQKIVNYAAKDWEGICHGWAPAAMNHSEPTPKTVTNPDGVRIPFGSSDIKALLSYFYAYPYQVPNTHQVGRRCFDSRVTTNSDCKQDLNAGAFHIILTNKIGLNNEGFIADMSRYREVWNHPIYYYESKVVNDSRGARNGSAPGTIRTVKMNTKVIYSDETKNYWDPIQGTSLQKVDRAEFGYILEINGYGEIIGGEWTSLKRPDFLWIKERPQQFFGYYYRIQDLLND